MTIWLQRLAASFTKTMYIYIYKPIQWTVMKWSYWCANFQIPGKITQEQPASSINTTALPANRTHWKQAVEPSSYHWHIYPANNYRDEQQLRETWVYDIVRLAYIYERQYQTVVKNREERYFRLCCFSSTLVWCTFSFFREDYSFRVDLEYVGDGANSSWQQVINLESQKASSWRDLTEHEITFSCRNFDRPGYYQV